MSIFHELYKEEVNYALDLVRALGELAEMAARELSLGDAALFASGEY